MNFLKKICIPFFLMLLLFSACQRDGEIETTGEIVDPEIETEVIEVNPLVARSGGPNSSGLDFDCFEITYPFDMVDENGENHTIDSEESFIELFEGEVILVDFVYPLDIVDNEGNTSVINDGEELAAAFALCLPDGGWEEGDFPAYSIDDENSCFDLVFPVTLVDLDENTIEVNNDEELNAAVAEGLYFFSFPFTLESEDGELVEVNSIDELFEALISCNGFEIEDSTFVWENGFEYIGCYMLEFPFEVVLNNGTTVIVEDHEEYCDLMLQGEIVDYSYPLTLTDQEGNAVTVENEEELYGLIDDCFDFLGFGRLDLSLLYSGTEVLNPDEMEPCYTINFPISLVYDNQNQTEELADLEAVFDLLVDVNLETEFSLVYPISLTLKDETEVSINQIEDLYPILQDCE